MGKNHGASKSRAVDKAQDCPLSMCHLVLSCFYSQSASLSTYLPEVSPFCTLWSLTFPKSLGEADKASSLSSH